MMIGEEALFLQLVLLPLLLSMIYYHLAMEIIVMIQHIVSGVQQVLGSIEENLDL